MSFQDRWNRFLNSGDDSSDSEEQRPPPRRFTTAAPPVNATHARQPVNDRINAPRNRRAQDRERRNIEWWTPPDDRVHVPPVMGVHPPREQRRVTFGANGTRRFTETIEGGDVPLWQAQMDHNYDLDRRNIEHGFADRMDERNHDYDMAALNANENIELADIEALERELENEINADMQYGEWDYNLNMEDIRLQKELLKEEIAFREAESRRAHERILEDTKNLIPATEALLKVAEQERKFYVTQNMIEERRRALEERRNARLNSEYNRDAMLDGMRLLRERRQLFSRFGFSADEAKYPTNSRISNNVPLPYMNLELPNYMHSILVTGADVVSVDNPFNPYIKLADGTIHELPNGFEGYLCKRQPYGSGIYVIHVCYFGADLLKKYYNRQYIMTKYCGKACNVQ